MYISLYQNFAIILVTSSSLASQSFGALSEPPLYDENPATAPAAIDAAELEGDRMLELIYEIRSIKFSGSFPEVQERDTIDNSFRVVRMLIEAPETKPVEANTWYFLSPEQMAEFRSRIDFILNLLVSYSKSEETDRRIHNRETSENIAQEAVEIVVEELFAIAREAAKTGSVSEATTVNMYRHLMSLISLREGHTHTTSKLNRDVLVVFRAIHEWVVEYIPHSHMLKYFKYKLKGGKWEDSFDKQKYKKEQVDSSEEFKKIQDWRANRKNDEVENLFKLEWNVITDRSINYCEANEAISALRDREEYHQGVLAFFSRWCLKIDEEIAEKERALQAKVAERAEREVKANQHAKVDPREALAAMMAALELEYETPSQTRKPKSKAAGGSSKPPETERKAESLKAKQSLAEKKKAEALDTEKRARLNAERAFEEAQRQAQLAATKADNVARNETLRHRKQGLAERRAAKAAQQEVEHAALLERKQSWMDNLYAEQQNLTSFNSDFLVDPSIFEGAADFDTARDELRAKGIYLGLHIHGNEKCVAMWKDHSGRNFMVWFDAPHGTQLKKGAVAGWAIALHKALRNSGRLLDN
jgi:hypothetical protein